MKPLFALTLANDHVGLLYRDPAGWQPLGEVAFDSATLDDGLQQLRAAALAIAPEGLATKVVIPNSEILYDRVVAPGPDPALRRAQIAAALDGRTPYALDELVFDWASEDGAGEGEVVAVAVVARETLAEAEGFAAAHGFNPVAFTAIPAIDAFPHEPWFGAGAAMLALPDGDQPEPDEMPLSTGPATDGLIDSEPEPEPETAVAATLPFEPAPPPEPEPAAPPAIDPDPVAEDAPAVATTAPFEPAPVAAPPADFDQPPAPVASWSPPPAETTMGADLAPHDDAAPETDATADAAVALDEHTRSWPGESEDESLDIRRAALGASLSAPAPIADAPIITASEPDPVAAPPLSAGAWSDDLPDDVPPLPSLRAGDDLRGIPPPAVIAAKLPNTSPSEKVRKALAKAPKTLKGKARKPAARPPEAPPLPAAASRPDVPPPTSEAEAMTVFGQRRQAVGGKPRYLGLILTLGLLLALAVVAFWAVRLVEPPPDDRAAAPAITTPDTAPTAGTELAETLTDTAPPPTATSEGQGVEQIAGDAVTTPSDEPADIDAGLLDESDLVDPTTLATDTGTDTGGADLTETAPETATATASDERVLPPTPTEEFALSLPDPAIVAAPPVQLTHGSMGQPADAAPGAAPVLPAYGALYQFDADGTIRATADGVVTPDGVFLVAARPPREPPPNPFAAQADAAPAATGDPPASGPAPGSIAALPATQPQAAPATPAAANSVAPADDAAVIAAESAFAPDNNVSRQRPRQRPADAAPPPGDSAPAAVEGALPAPVVDDAMPISVAAIRPAARPARISAAAAAAQEQAAATAAAAAAAASTSALALAMAEPAATIRPAARPAALSRRVEPAAAAAAAAATVAPRAAPSGHSRSTHQPSQDQDFDDGEPEPVRAAPAVPTRAGVAQQATVGRALNLGRLNLIGVFGTTNARRALVRESGGRVVSVKVGDRLDGGQVTAIGQSDLSYLKGRQTVRLQLPRS